MTNIMYYKVLINKACNKLDFTDRLRKGNIARIKIPFPLISSADFSTKIKRCINEG